MQLCNLMKTAIERFEEKIIKVNGSCWIWNAGHNGLGYGRFWNGEKQIYSHRFSYEFFKSPIPEGFVIDHLCKNPFCVNPEHLEAVTQKINYRRGDHPEIYLSGGLRKKTHCKSGHPFDEKNTGLNINRRYCKQCARDSSLKYIRKKQKKHGH